MNEIEPKLCSECNDVIDFKKSNFHDYSHDECILYIHNDCVPYEYSYKCPQCKTNITINNQLEDDLYFNHHNCDEDDNHCDVNNDYYMDHPEQEQEKIVEQEENPEEGYNKEINPDTTCTICGDDINDPRYLVKTSCNHVYHYHCLMEWFCECNNRECPYCRQTYDKIPMFKSNMELTDLYFPNFNKNSPNLMNHEIPVKRCAWNHHQYFPSLTEIEYNGKIFTIHENQNKINQSTIQQITIKPDELSDDECCQLTPSHTVAEEEGVHAIAEDKCAGYSIFPHIDMCLMHYEYTNYNHSLFMMNFYKTIIFPEVFKEAEKCSHAQCTRKAVIWFHGSTYCTKHQPAKEKKKLEFDIEFSVAILKNNKCAHITFDGVKDVGTGILKMVKRECKKTVHFASGNLELCRGHYEKQIEVQIREKCVKVFNDNIREVYNYRLEMSEYFCTGYINKIAKCLEFKKDKHGFCKKPKNHYMSLRTKNKKCKWKNPITREKCVNEKYDQTGMCILHTILYYGLEHKFVSQTNGS
jgi:hypothetical protein